MIDFGSGPEPMRKIMVERRAKREAQHGKEIPTGISYLDDRLLGLLPSDLMLIGAETGAGKTTLAMLIAQLAALRGYRPTFFALEAYRGEFSDRLIYRELARLAWERQHPDRYNLTFRRWQAGRVTELERDHLDEAESTVAKIADRIRVFYRGQKFDAADVTRELLAAKDGTDFFVFDHVHYVDTDDPNENRGLKAITQALRNASLLTERPTIAVAHLRKRTALERGKRVLPTLDDFHGSSDLVKIATAVVLLAPTQETSRPRNLAPTIVHFAKDRYDGADRTVGIVDFDRDRNSYRKQYTLCRLGDHFEPVTDLPNWAHHAKQPDCAPDPRSYPG